MPRRGRTRVARRLWMAELAPVDDPEDVPDAVLTALGARETVLRGAGAEELRAAERHGDDPLVRLAEHCSRRRMLLLLDNCEHVIEAAAVLAETAARRPAPGLTVLATSREPLGVPGELVRPVDPLPDPMALRLFADRGARRPARLPDRGRRGRGRARSAAASTGFRWPSNWPRPACGCSPRGRSPTASTTGSGC